MSGAAKNGLFSLLGGEFVDISSFVVIRKHGKQPLPDRFYFMCLGMACYTKVFPVRVSSRVLCSCSYKNRDDHRTR